MDPSEERTQQRTRTPNSPRAPMPGPLGADWMNPVVDDREPTGADSGPTDVLHLDEMFVTQPTTEPARGPATAPATDQTIPMRVVPVRSEPVANTPPTALTTPERRQRLRMPALDFPAVDITPMVDRIFGWLERDDHGLIAASWVVGAILLLVVAANGH